MSGADTPLCSVDASYGRKARAEWWTWMGTVQLNCCEFFSGAIGVALEGVEYLIVP